MDDHGGSLGRARRLFPLAPEPWIDLSTGINPHSYPLFDFPATAFTRLPEPGREKALRAAAAAAYGAPSPALVVAAPGTQILLPLVMGEVAPGRTAVLGPTYAEHARAAALVGHRVEETSDFNDLYDADVAVAVNPNNPDGRLAGREALLELADRLGRRGGLLVVDEAFMDVGPAGASLAPDTGRPGLVVLRSFGKFFGLAGVRLGFALAEETVAARLAARLGPWAVSGPALEIGLKALSDGDWQQATRSKLATEAARLDRLLDRFGLAATGGTDLYRFVETIEAPRLFDVLGSAGVLVRNFSWSERALRFGLPGDEAAWSRLEQALAVWSMNSRLEVEKNQ